jgi:hypothetical protein
VSFFILHIFISACSDPYDWFGWKGLVTLLTVCNGVLASCFNRNLDVRDRIFFAMQCWSLLREWKRWLELPAQKARVR